MKDKLKDIVGKYRYPLIIFVVGLCLLLPGSMSGDKETSDSESELLQHILSCSDGVGEAKVLISENGVIVVCKGAENASVRYNIMGAVKAYTGFSADRITVLKMVN